MLTVAGITISAIGVFALWGTLVWLIVILFREADVRRPIGGVLTASIIISIGGLLFGISILTSLGDVLNPAIGSDETDIKLPLILGVDEEEALDESGTSDVEVLSPEAQKLAEALRVSLIGMRYEDDEFDQRLEFTFEYENLSFQSIRAFTGILIFKDIFGRTIKKVVLTPEVTIAWGEIYTDRGKGMDVNQFIASDLQLATTAFEDLTMTFETESIIFTDGTRLGSVE